MSSEIRLAQPRSWSGTGRYFPIGKSLRKVRRASLDNNPFCAGEPLHLEKLFGPTFARALPQLSQVRPKQLLSLQVVVWCPEPVAGG